MKGMECSDREWKKGINDSNDLLDELLEKM
jgi:hypothetical protein